MREPVEIRGLTDAFLGDETLKSEIPPRETPFAQSSWEFQSWGRSK